MIILIYESSSSSLPSDEYSTRTDQTVPDVKRLGLEIEGAEGSGEADGMQCA